MEKERHKKAVEENRQYLKQLSTAVLSLCKQELPLRGHDERSDRRNHRKLQTQFNTSTSAKLRAKLDLHSENQLDSMNLKIGFDEEMIKNPSIVDEMYNFVVEDKQFFDNYVNSVAWKVKTRANELANSVDSNRWSTPFFSWSATYKERGGRSELVVPAGLLQPPLFRANGPMAINFGAIGATIAYEVLHGFENYWRVKPGVYQCAVILYSNYVVKDLRLPVDGHGTLAENIADMGGIKLAKKAFDLWTASNQKSAQVSQLLPGVNLTSSQAFYVAFAQNWCKKGTIGAQFDQLRGQHAPENYRVIGSLSQFGQFAEDFMCSAGSQMRPIHPCVIW